MAHIVTPSDRYPQVLNFPNRLDNVTKDDDSKYLTTHYSEQLSTLPNCQSYKKQSSLYEVSLAL